MIAFQGQLQESEFTRAQWASTPKLFRWIGWLMVACLAMVLATGGLKPILQDPVDSMLKLGFALAFTLFMLIAPRRAIKKVWRNTPLLHERITGQLSEESVAWKTASSDSTFGWDKIIKRRITNDLCLLYTSTSQALILPRSYFASESDWTAAKELIARKIAAA